MMRRGFWFIALLALLVTACSARPSSSGTEIRGQSLPEGLLTVDARSVRTGGRVPAPGRPAPDFTLVGADGTRHRLSDYRGRPVVINFWATWCPPCRAEMPALDQAYHQHREAGLLVIGVNMQESREVVQAFRESLGVHFPFALDEKGAVSRQYQVRGLPTTFFIAPDGTVAVRWTGMLTEEALTRILSAILQENAQSHVVQP